MQRLLPSAIQLPKASPKISKGPSVSSVGVSQRLRGTTASCCPEPVHPSPQGGSASGFMGIEVGTGDGISPPRLSYAKSMTPVCIPVSSTTPPSLFPPQSKQIHLASVSCDKDMTVTHPLITKTLRLSQHGSHQEHRHKLRLRSSQPSLSGAWTPSLLSQGNRGA